MLAGLLIGSIPTIAMLLVSFCVVQLPDLPWLDHASAAFSVGLILGAASFDVFPLLLSQSSLPKFEYVFGVTLG